jgi:hypothetical protein
MAQAEEVKPTVAVQKWGERKKVQTKKRDSLFSILLSSL